MRLLSVYNQSISPRTRSPKVKNKELAQTSKFSVPSPKKMTLERPLYQTAPATSAHFGQGVGNISHPEKMLRTYRQQRRPGKMRVIQETGNERMIERYQDLRSSDLRDQREQLWQQFDVQRMIYIENQNLGDLKRPGQVFNLVV